MFGIFPSSLWAGTTSVEPEQPWSRGWTGTGPGSWQGCVSKRAPLWACRVWSPQVKAQYLHQRQVQFQLNQAYCALEWLKPRGERGLESHLISSSPVHGVPTSSQLSPSPGTKNKSTDS